MLAYPHYTADVRQFHKSFGCAAPNAPMPMDDQTRLARLQLITEEHSELIWACAALDAIKMLDSLGDIEYVLCGTIVACGGDMCGHPIPRTVSLTTAMPHFPPADVTLVTSAGFIEGIGALSLALSTNRWEAVTKVSADLLSHLAKMWTAYGVGEDLRQAILAEIHRSNMTKFDADGNPVVNEAGRVVKGPNFEEPRILEVVRSIYPHWNVPPLRKSPSTPLSGAVR